MAFPSKNRIGSVKNFFKYLIRITKPYVWRLAEAYDLKVQRPGFGYGRYQVEIEDQDEALRHRIPKSVYFNTASGRIRIGKNVSFGEGVMLLTGMHMNMTDAARNGVQFHNVPESGRDITIEEGVFIGSGAIIVGPVTIKAFSTVAAGAIVVKTVESMTMVACSPATVVRKY